MKTKWIIALFCGIFSSNVAVSQSISYGLDSLLRKSLDSMRVVLNTKSLSAAIQFNDSVSWSYATGISSQSPLVNVTPNHAYLIGSVTKTMTAACVLQLVDEGILQLEDSVGKWLPPMQHINPNVTLRQLLRHQSGLYDALSHPNAQPTLIATMDSVWEPAVFLANFMQPPVFQPGTSWQYSNTNYFLLGMIIEAATGNPYYTELRNRFFTPLDMTSTLIPAYEPLAMPVAHVWLDINGDGLTDDAHNFYINYLALNSVAGAAGGYYSTPTETSKWMRTYMRGDLHSSDIMAEAKTTVSSPGLPGTTYGLGLMKKSFIGYQGWGHGGDLAYSASSWYFPAKDISITVFCNDADVISWELAPVISALLKGTNQAGSISSVASGSDSEPFVRAFPNPFSESLIVEMQCPQKMNQLKMVMYNSIGQVVAEVNKENVDVEHFTYEWENLSHLPSGMYFMRIFMDEKEVKSVRLLKQK